MKLNLSSFPPIEVLKGNWDAFWTWMNNNPTIVESIWFKRLERVCDSSKSGHYERHPLIWKDIQGIISKYPKSPISGGIFLYSRQQILLKFMVKILSHRIHEQYGRRMRFCETGFGSGHSSSLILSSIDNVDVISFDKFDRPYQIPIANMLSEQYPGRFLRIEGDSCKTVPKYLSSHFTNSSSNVNNITNHGHGDKIQCDFLHGSSLCPTDNIDLVTYSPPGVILTSTAMNSLSEKAVYFGPNAQWRKLRNDGCIQNITCFEEDEIQLSQNYVFNKAGGKISHRHCMAISTGKCQPTSFTSMTTVGQASNDTNSTNGATSTLISMNDEEPLVKILTSTTSATSLLMDFSYICSKYQVQVPN